MSPEIIGILIAFGVLSLTLGVHIATTSRNNGKLEERGDQTAKRQEEDRKTHATALERLTETFSDALEKQAKLHAEALERQSRLHAEAFEKQANKHEAALKEQGKAHEIDLRELTTKIERWAERDTAQDAAKAKHLDEKFEQLKDAINRWGQLYTNLEGRMHAIEKASGLSGKMPAAAR